MADKYKMERRLETLTHHLSPSLSQTPSSLSFTSPFLYSRGSGSLSEAERGLYEEHGFVVVKELVSVNQLELYARRFDQIVSGEVEKEGLTVMKDVAQLGASQVTSIIDISICFIFGQKVPSLIFRHWPIKSHY